MRVSEVEEGIGCSSHRLSHDEVRVVSATELIELSNKGDPNKVLGDANASVELRGSFIVNLSVLNIQLDIRVELLEHVDDSVSSGDLANMFSFEVEVSS